MRQYLPYILLACHILLITIGFLIRSIGINYIGEVMIFLSATSAFITWYIIAEVRRYAENIQRINKCYWKEIQNLKDKSDLGN